VTREQRAQIEGDRLRSGSGGADSHASTRRREIARLARVIGLGAAIVASLAVWSTSGMAQETASEAVAQDEVLEAPGFEPRLSLGFGVLTQSHKGEAQVPTETASTTLSDRGDSLISQHFKIGLDLMTPAQLEVYTKPRLVLKSSVQLPVSRGLISNRADSKFDLNPPNAAFAENCPATIGTPPILTNTCSVRLRNRSTIETIWTAGLGIDFTLPFDEQQFHFTQGFEYIGMAVQAEGTYLRRSTGGSFGQNESEYIDVKGNPELYHGISITENLSVDAYVRGPLVFGFYLEGRMSWFATDRDMSVSQSTDRGRFEFVSSLNDPEPIQYQLLGGVTMRFDPRWLR
jgi:hypothetical protein